MTSKRTGGRSISLMGAISATAKRPRDRETKRRGDQSATERPGGAINLLLRDQTGGGRFLWETVNRCSLLTVISVKFSNKMGTRIGGTEPREERGFGGTEQNRGIGGTGGTRNWGN